MNAIIDLQGHFLIEKSGDILLLHLYLAVYRANFIPKKISRLFFHIKIGNWTEFLSEISETENYQWPSKALKLIYFVFFLFRGSISYQINFKLSEISKCKFLRIATREILGQKS